MSTVVNDVVKMEWSEEGWLQSAATKKGAGVFFFASKVYPSTTKGEVTVFFNPDTAYIFASDAHTADEDLWNAAEVKAIIKDVLGDFPYRNQEYVPIIASGLHVCSQEYLEEYGIVEFKADIEARLRDIEPYGYEFVVDKK